VPCCVKGLFDVQEYSSIRHIVIEILRDVTNESYKQALVKSLGSDPTENTVLSSIFVLPSNAWQLSCTENSAPTVACSLERVY
jgi:hypothetical protein